MALLLNAIIRLSLLPAVLLLAMLNPHAFAQYDDGPTKYPWSDQPEYSSPHGNPAPGHDGYNSYQRQQEQMDHQRQRSLEADRQRQRDSEDHSLGYRPPSVTILPDGKAITCLGPTRGNPVTTCY